ncbi:Hypothetical_protein [Hexamita inflata]|uniref:Hypothetical_protein n=1 Tax=Hexamita inflata TaxID=28002 RepID=A0AA86V8N5_9EUKA|nr:Hypothetical protein HINF_LOCUS47088 [Hexamita inflata]
MQRLEPIRFITGMYSIIIIIRQIYVTILAQLFTESGDAHIQNVVSLHKFGIHGILFVQGFRMHIKINQQSYNIYELLKNLAMQYVRQAIPLILMLLLTINIPWFAKNKCNHETINYLEFLQIPALLDNSNTCGAIIHMYSTQCFFNLLLICTYILFEILNISKTNIKAAYISQLGFWFLVQIILVSQRSKSSIDVEYQMLEGTLDGQSYYSGALFGYYLFNLSPMQDAKESSLGKVLLQYIPNKIIGSLLVYGAIFLQQNITIYLALDNSFLILKYIIQKTLHQIILSLILTMCSIGFPAGKLKLIEQINDLECDFVLASHILIQILAVLLDGIKIGPQQDVIVWLVAIGLLAEVLFCINFATYLYKDLIYLFMFK